VLKKEHHRQTTGAVMTAFLEKVKKIRKILRSDEGGRARIAVNKINMLSFFYVAAHIKYLSITIC